MSIPHVRAERCSALRVVTLLLPLVMCAWTPVHAATQVGSAPYEGSATGSGTSYAPMFSADGKHVAFVSHANNLVTNDDLAPHLDLFLRDLVSSNTVLVSVNSNGIGGGNDNIGLYTLSSNAQVIAFDIAANNLAPGDSNRVSDIYVRNLVAGTTRLLTPGANGASSNPLISEDGRRVIFESLASNLVTNDFNGTNDIFIHDLTTGITELITVSADGTASPDGPSHSPSISADGFTVAFVSHATNLVEGVSNKLGEIYARNVAAGSTRWAAGSQLWPNRQGTEKGYPWWLFTQIKPPSGPYSASQPTLSADGRYVAFETPYNLVRFDLQRPTRITVQSFPSNEPGKANYFSYMDNPRFVPCAGNTTLAFSADGRFAGFGTASNSWPVYSPGVGFVDFETLTTNILTSTPYGVYFVTNVVPYRGVLFTNLAPISSSSWGQMPWLRVTLDGSQLFFLADATLSFSNPSVSSFQLFSYSWLHGFHGMRLLSTNLAGQPGPDLGAIIPALSPDGSLISWESPDDSIVPDDSNRVWDVFVRNVDTGATEAASIAHPDLSLATGGAMSKIAGAQSISSDGSRLLMLTRDSNLVPNDTNRLTDSVLRDLRANTNRMVSGAFFAPVSPQTQIIKLFESTNEVVLASLSTNGRYAMFIGGVYDVSYGIVAGLSSVFWSDLELDTNDFAADRVLGRQPVLSPDGRMIATDGYFDGIQSGRQVIVLRDMRALSAVSRLMSGRRGGADLAPDGPSLNPVFSPDSRWLVFQSLASDLTYDPDPGPTYQLYAREIDTPFMKRISYSVSEGTNVFALAGGSTNPVFTADARFVFFESNTSKVIYRHDMFNDMDDTDTARRPNLVVCTGCANPSASSEGRYVAYESRPAPGGMTNIFMKDLAGGQEELISISMTGTNGNGSSFTPLLSHDARFVVFASKASDLVPGDNNRATDIFVRDRMASVTHCLSGNFAGTGTGNRVSSNPILSADGRTAAFQSFASDLVPGDYNDTRDVFVVTLGGPDTDLDGMDDDWEIAYFSTLSRDGTGDFDRDGATDLDEFRAGTNPGNDASILRVLTLTTRVAAGPNGTRSTVVLWSAIPGKTYRVQFKSDLNTAWSAVGEDVVASTTSASMTDVQEANGAAADSHRFYRVLLVQ